MQILKDNKDAINKLTGDSDAVQLYLAIQSAGGRIQASRSVLADMAVISLTRDTSRYRPLNRAIQKLIKLDLITVDGDTYMAKSGEQTSQNWRDGVDQVAKSGERTGQNWRDGVDQVAKSGERTGQNWRDGVDQVAKSGERTGQNWRDGVDQVAKSGEQTSQNWRDGVDQVAKSGEQTSQNWRDGVDQVAKSGEQIAKIGEKSGEISPYNLTGINNNKLNRVKYKTESPITNHIKNKGNAFKLNYNKFYANYFASESLINNNLPALPSEQKSFEGSDRQRLAELFHKLHEEVHGARLLWSGRESKMLGVLLEEMGAEVLEQRARGLAGVVKKEIARGGAGNKWWRCAISPSQLELRKNEHDICKKADTHYAKQDEGRPRPTQEAWDARSKMDRGEMLTRAEICLVGDYFLYTDVDDDTIQECDVKFLADQREREALADII